jgi:hypothetical protein
MKIVKTTTSLYNPETGSECNHITTDGFFCVQENRYSYVAPAMIFLGFALVEKYIVNDVTKHGKTIAQSVTFGFLAVDSVSNFLFPKKEELNLPLSERYSEIVKNSTHYATINELNDLRAQFKAFSKECESSHGFKPAPPPAFTALYASKDHVFIPPDFATLDDAHYSNTTTPLIGEEMSS